MQTPFSLWYTFRRTAKLLYGLAPRDIPVLIILLVLQGLTPTAIIYLTKATIDGINRFLGGESINLALLAFLWCGTLLIDQILSVIVQQVQGNVSERLTTGTNGLLIQRVASLPGLDVIEDPKYHNDLDILQKGAQFRPLNITLTSASLVREAVTAISVSIALFSISWWSPFILIALSIPYARHQLKIRERMWRLQINRTPEARELSYDSRIALSAEFAKDVRLHNLAPWIFNRFTSRAGKLQEESRALRGRANLNVIPSLFLSGFGAISVFLYAIYRAKRGFITIGGVALSIQALSRLQSAVTEFIAYLGLLTEHLSYFKQLLDFLDVKPRVTEPENPEPLPSKIGISFNNVSFIYPDGRKVLHNLSIYIPPRQIVAIVGENGAGKSTMIKLLLRYYDPTEGYISIDNVDLKNLNINSWRSQIAAVFQDFGRFDFTIAENITLGLEREDRKLNESITFGGFNTVLDALSDGADTRLGKAFGGTELSGGQWQKLAISRALYRDAQLLILDEPTSALDPRSEAELFQRFAELAEGRTAVLVTHRLSSVRMADRILVLKQGEIVEDGSHAELIELNGEYADLWQLQALQYSDNKNI